MKGNFEECMKFVLAPDNDGQGFHIDPHDPGGATIQGITIGTYRSFYGITKTLDDFKNITMDEVYNIYKSMFWNKLSCDDLPSGLDLLVFDFAVTSGTYRSAKFLQEDLNVVVDGNIGPKTLEAISKHLSDSFLYSLYERQIAFYQSLSTFKYFGNGWTRRTTQRYTLSKQMYDNFPFQTHQK